MLLSRLRERLLHSAISGATESPLGKGWKKKKKDILKSTVHIPSIIPRKVFMLNK